MAHRRDAFLCILVLLVSASLSLPCINASDDVNEIEILNEKTNISFHSTIFFENSTTISVPPGTTLVQLQKGATYDYLIPNGTVNVITTFETVNATGTYYQNVYTWANVQAPFIPCTTNCSWTVDDQGFSVADVSKGALPVLQFMVSWSGPYPDPTRAQ